KSYLVSATVLAIPDFSKKFTVETDASDNRVGAVLQQGGHPIAFMSKALSPWYQGLSTYNKEYLAMIVEVDQWRPYLQHAEFDILIDQRCLVHLETQRLLTPWQQKAFTKLLGLHYCIKYRKGVDNSAANSLSRSNPEEILYIVTSCRPAWLEDVLASYNSNPHAQKLLEQLALREDPKKRFSLHQGLLRFRDLIWLGGSTELHQKIIAAFHDSPLGGHSGFPVTYKRIHRLFAWPKMKVHIKHYVQCCQVCQQAKPDRTASPGLLQHLPIPKQPWDIITMDFIDGLPQSSQFNCLLVLVDKRSRFAHFLPLAHPYIAAKVAQLYMSQIYKLHGFTGAIVSDRDPVFTSHFRKELFQYAGTELRLSTANHPQTDGQTERVNQCIETFLRCFTHACPRRWSFWIPLAQFWYNSSPHSAIGMSPFKALYGHEPHHLGITAASNASVPCLQAWLEERQVTQNLIQQHLHRARQCMKAQADKKRSFWQFQVGDQVFLKLQPYIQTSVAPSANHKLSFKFF
uniref:Integrase catalytic domain-containing protein n=1 Tax=Aegilops tauschii subsp. strangulata TaxID=200361 RepID=A0A453RBY7_AEGTS